jgi:hypothetical protein
LGDLGGLGIAVFRFFCCLVVLVVLVLLVVFLFFFSLFLQFVLLQRIVDINVFILKKEFFVPNDGGVTTWRFGLSEAHNEQNPSKKLQIPRVVHLTLLGKEGSKFKIQSSRLKD